MMFRFDNPELLWLLLLIPALALLRGRMGTTGTVRFSAAALAGRAAKGIRSRAGAVLVGLRWLALALLVVAVARPQSGSSTSEIEASGIDIVLAIDLSGSMLALDFELKNKTVTRIAAVKDVVRNFIEKRPTDRIGIVAFASNPYIVSPNTLNHEWLQENLARMQVGLIEQGTNIGPAIGMAVNRLRSIEDSKSRVVVLLTDGKDDPPPEVSPVAYAETAAAYGIKVYTIAAGSNGQVPVLDQKTGRPARSPFGLYTRQFPVDEEILKKISDITDARFFRATDTTELQAIYDEIDRLEKTEVKLRYRTEYTDIFAWPAMAGIVLLGLEQLLGQTRWRRLP